MDNITDLLRPHVPAIIKAASAGDPRAAQIISLHGMHVRCPQDPAAPALCQAAFEDWLAHLAKGQQP